MRAAHALTVEADLANGAVEVVDALRRGGDTFEVGAQLVGPAVGVIQALGGNTLEVLAGIAVGAVEVVEAIPFEDAEIVDTAMAWGAFVVGLALALEGDAALVVADLTVVAIAVEIAFRHKFLALTEVAKIIGPRAVVIVEAFQRREDALEILADGQTLAIVIGEAVDVVTEIVNADIAAIRR